MKILIAEDNAFSRTLLKKTLSKAGYDVHAVEDGHSAWDALQQPEGEIPKLALIDWMMPGMSGVELCRKIREQETASPIYIILLTAKTEKEDVIEGFAAGADDFIKKPFDSGELLARIQVGRRLVEQHALLHCLIDSIPDPIYFKDNRGLYLGCNKAYETFVGKDESEIINRTDNAFLPESQAQVTHMEDLRVLASGEALESEGWTTGSDGAKVYLSTLKTTYMESAAGFSGMIGISRDLTKRIEMEQEVQRLAVAVEQSTESILIADQEGVTRYVNSAFISITGYTKEEVLGKTPDLFRTEQHDDEFYKTLLRTIFAGSKWEGRITSCRKDGTLFDVEAFIYPIRDDTDQILNYVAISRDVTHEIAVERQLRQTQKMNAIGELAGGISHDFNNILTAILGYVALCMNSVDEGDKVQDYLKEIVKAGDRATKLVRQILTFSRQEEQDFQSVDIHQVVEDSLSMVQTTIKSNIIVESDLTECGPVLGDTTQLQQVMVNLCTNAVHALAKEKGTLRVAMKPVELLGKKRGEQVVDLSPGLYACITVEDTGCGMTAETMERIFEPYYTTKKKGEGTGFGLSIVHGIVNKHSGYIAVESELGKGTLFTLYFPLLIGTNEEKIQAIDHSTPEGFGQILFVDDDAAVLAMGREILESFGYTVSVATNGKQALEIFQQDSKCFDALVSDYSMPEMNGYELIRECLSLEPGLPSILCSGYRQKAEGENLEDLGHTAFVTKPLDWRELSRTIQQEINKRT
jgi:two-component system cell cycle sensor histidine kinase/response regulator CckA